MNFTLFGFLGFQTSLFHGWAGKGDAWHSWILGLGWQLLSEALDPAVVVVKLLTTAGRGNMLGAAASTISVYLRSLAATLTRGPAEHCIDEIGKQSTRRNRYRAPLD